MRARSLRAASWLGVVLCLACVGSIEQTGERYRHRNHGFALGAPQGSAGAWERVEVDGATLAFRSPEDDTVILKSRCGKPVATPQLMARHLVFGLSDREVVASHPVSVGGAPGWLQIVDTTEKGAAVRLKSITVVKSDCSVDLVLAAERERFAAIEPVFDGWWESLELSGSEGAP